jgi:20S proteasome subunit alpha 5
MSLFHFIISNSFSLVSSSSLFQLGSCSIGVRTNFGVVLAVEKRVSSPLLEQSSVDKILEVDSHIAVAVSGLIADARTLVNHGRVESQNHRFTYDEPMKVESLTQSICDLALSFGEGGEENKSKMSRPFGVALLIGGIDDHGPQLYHTDPSGTYVRWDAQAIGSGSEGARTILQERYNKGMSLEDALILVMRVLEETMEDKITNTNVEIATVTKENGFQFVAKEKVQELITKVAAEVAAERR